MGGPPPPPAIEGQTYCLRWNNHKSNLVEILDVLIKVESYVDCTIVVDDQVQFKAHRVVLAANSPYFQSILQDVPMDHCSIIFPGVKAFEMRALLEYMYTGEVNVTQSQIPKIMRIAEELEVKGLFDMADLKEKFNKLSDEHGERPSNPYSVSSMDPSSSYPTTATSSSGITNAQNGSKDFIQQPQNPNNSSSVISTSANISPPVAPSSSSSPPYGYKSPFASLYSKSPGPSLTPSTTVSQSAAPITTLTSSHAQIQQPITGSDRSQWPLSPSAAAAAMLSSVYESAPDMNPLKRKKLSSLSSMLMNRDTPILRTVLAQNNPVDSTHPMPLILPSTTTTTVSATSCAKTDKPSLEKNSSHATLVPSGHNNNHSFNGSDYSDKKYQEEPHSPYTDRSFDDESFDHKGGAFPSNFGSNNSNQKPEWKRYKQYTRNDIMSAIQCVRDGMSALQASRKFGVPSRTLYDKVKKLGITTGRPMNRTLKRSPSGIETSAAFPYAHGYGQTEPMLSGMHDPRDEREARDELQHHRADSHHLATTIPHPAATLLDHAFLQQALENRGSDMVAGREALHAMALAAAAHAAANRMSSSPGPNESSDARSPSPNFSLKYNQSGDRETMLDRESEREVEDDDDQVEDLSVARKSPDEKNRPSSPYSPPAEISHRKKEHKRYSATCSIGSENGSNSVIVQPLGSKLNPNQISNPATMDHYEAESIDITSGLKREIITDDVHAD